MNVENLVLAANEVMVGDRIYNSRATHPAFRWARVNQVVPTVMANGRDGIELITSGWHTVADAREGIRVQRLITKPR